MIVAYSEGVFFSLTCPARNVHPPFYMSSVVLSSCTALSTSFHKLRDFQIKIAEDKIVFLFSLKLFPEIYFVF